MHDTTQHEVTIENIARWLSFAVIAIALCTVALHIASAALAGIVWDDAYMYARYAHNILAHGAIAWNGSTPTYGLTSQAQLLLSVPLAAITSNPTLVALWGSLLGALLFLLSIPFLVGSVVSRSEKLTYRVCVAASFAFIAFATPPFALLAASGMDTMLALAFLSLYLIFILSIARSLGSASRARLLGVGVLGGFAYLVRPDLMLFTVLIPLSLALWSASASERKHAWALLDATVLSLAVVLLAAWLYFGTPLPLPFYAKSGLLYGDILRKRFLFQPILQLIGFVDNYKYLFLALVALTAYGWRRIFTRGEHAIVIGMIAAVVASIGYYLFFVLQVMGGDGRFYYPTLPVLVVLASIVIAYIFREFRGSDAERMRAWLAAALCAVLLASMYTPFFWGAEQFGYVVARERPVVATVWHADIRTLYGMEDGNRRTWPCLDVFAGLPDDASSATTEVGMVAAIAPDKYVLDISGLNSTDIALKRVGAGDAVVALKIDLVYLPWEQSYPELRHAILSSDAFQKGYTVFAKSDLGSLDDVALRSDSSYAAPLRACLSSTINSRKKNMQGTSAAQTTGSDQFYSLTLPYPLMVVK